MRKALLSYITLIGIVCISSVAVAGTEGHSKGSQKGSHKGSHSSDLAVPKAFIPPKPYKLSKLYKQIKKTCPSQALECYESELFKITALHGPKASVDVFAKLQRKNEVKEKIDGHHIVHHIGHNVASAFGPFPEALGLCPTTYNYGCIHGFLQQALGQKMTEPKDAIKLCDIFVNDPNATPKDKVYCYHGMGHGVMMYFDYDMKKAIEMCELFKKALKINPKNDATYMAYSNCPPRDDFVELEELVKKALEINPKNVTAYGKLAYYSQEQGKFDEAEELLKKALKINPEDANIYYYLQTLLYKNNKKGKAVDGYSQKISEIDAGWYPPVTIQNYQILKNTVTNKGIKLVSMQYPVRSVESLKKIFKSKEGLVFVDNEQIFKEAIARENYDKYFTDNFGGDFGHCTIKCNRLLAENVANVILKEFFKKK